MEKKQLQKVPEKMIIEDQQSTIGSTLKVPEEFKNHKYDFKQYSFAPLLLFNKSDYFDKGFSNYNSVEEFYRPIVSNKYGIDMITNVIYDRKNMKYDELTDHCIKNKVMITCCIDEHFTALAILAPDACLYYDPMSPAVKLIYGADSVQKFVVFHLMKCKYGDQGHVSENKDYYTGGDSTPLRKYIYQTWQKLMDLEVGRLYSVNDRTVKLELNSYYFLNNAKNPELMSTQATGNTCYFQTYLFCLLVRTCEPTGNKSSSKIPMKNIEVLKDLSIDICQYTLTFYFNEEYIRPYNNSNILCDYIAYKSSSYYTIMTSYLEKYNITIDYETQYKNIVKYLEEVKVHQNFNNITSDEKMASSINTKQLQLVTDTANGREKLCVFNYYKYRPANMCFGFNTNIMRKIDGFNEFNSLRKNFLISVYEKIKDTIKPNQKLMDKCTIYKDYYFLPQFEIGQQELIDLNLYTYFLDYQASCSQKNDIQAMVKTMVANVNSVLLPEFNFSKNKQNSYEKIMPKKDFAQSKEHLQGFLNFFMSLTYFQNYCALGFNEYNPKEKEFNCLTQSVFYDTELMRRQMYRMEFEFERECINQMAKSTLSKYMSKVDNAIDQDTKYNININIGQGITYSKYSNLLHYINVVDQYWNNPDINYIQIFGKDIRNILGFICQKICFSDDHDFYHYGHLENSSNSSSYYNYGKKDLLVANEQDYLCPLLQMKKTSQYTSLIISDRVFEFNYIKNILRNMLSTKKKVIKTDDEAINYCLLSLILDFGLYEDFSQLINLPFLHDQLDKQQLQIQISNMINEIDKANKEAIQRSKIENLIYECSNKFIVNAKFNVQSWEFKIMNLMNSDQSYQSYLIMCKIYMSLCQINKSVELDYYKLKCDDSYKIIIPYNYSHTTSEYLDTITHQYHFYLENHYICYDNMKFFNISQKQPEIQLFKVRLKSFKPIESMYRYVEISNSFMLDEQKYVFFVAGNILVFQQNQNGKIDITVNNIPIEYDLMCFNEAISLVPCFRYMESYNGNSDVTLVHSPHMYYHVDNAGQFNENYYGMKFELIECIKLVRSYVDLNDNHQFQEYKLHQLVTESKSVFHYPNFLLQVQSQDQLISLIDLALKFRNISFFLLVFMQFQRTALEIHYIQKENKTVKISGPWLNALLYAVGKDDNKEYDRILKKQYFQIDQFKDLPLTNFIDEICENFVTYQKHLDDGSAQIIPTQKQKDFIQKIVTGKESFYFSEVGSGKTKVILPILCQMFLSNHLETHKYFAKQDNKCVKQALFIIVPEHLVLDAKSQVYRYCLNLNFKKDYKIFDDIFSLLHQDVDINGKQKKIFISSFNQFKKALTYDKICRKVQDKQDNIMLLIDEVDDFLDRDKLVFNICQNKNNDFEKNILHCYYNVSSHIYHSYKELQSENIQSEGQIDTEQQLDLSNYPNPEYWKQLLSKLQQINTEIQLKSKSINKSFGIFNEETLKHCQNIAHDIEGYKCLIARPYESVNRGMSGSYYSDVERTIYLTYYILMEDTEKYNDLFQSERKNITFEFFIEFIQKHHLDYDDLVYGRNTLTNLITQFPEIKKPLVRYLFEIILRKMEIHDKSRSVNSIDVIFNFDCTGFTGTPFIDNYPTYQYIRKQKTHQIPSLIYKNFYLHSNNPQKNELFKEKFIEFQGDNNNIFVKYHNSDFIQNIDHEEEILNQIFTQQKDQSGFNCIVDLCGVFKRITMHGVRNALKKVHGTSQFKYIYYIDPIDCSDRILFVENDNDVQYDDEFYKYMSNKYQENASQNIFFYIDNRNVIGKDIPYQLIFQKKFNKPLIYRSVVVAHDVDDFSKIWQAMGRSRTMNKTKFIIYKNNLQQLNQQSLSESKMEIEQSKSNLSQNAIDLGFQNMQNCDISKHLYIKNCDKKVIGNISSIYQTLIAIFNLSQNKLYYTNEIINIFILKLEGTIDKLLKEHSYEIIKYGFNNQATQHILINILEDKISVNNILKNNEDIDLNDPKFLQQTIQTLIQYKFEQLRSKEDESIQLDIVKFLSGEAEHQMEVSYTKQQQKQKQNQYNKNQDSDTMQQFSAEKQINLTIKQDNYWDYTRLSQKTDVIKEVLNLPILNKEICKIAYKESENDTKEKFIRIFPTVQFLYSLYINPHYINDKVKKFISEMSKDTDQIEKYFIKELLSAQNSMEEEDDENKQQKQQNQKKQKKQQDSDSDDDLEEEDIQIKLLMSKKQSQFQYKLINLIVNNMKQNPQFNLVNVGPGLFVIGMKNQFSKHDLQNFALKKYVNYVCDETCHILYNNEECQNDLGQSAKLQSFDNFKDINKINPYNLDLYIFLDAVTKQELANNVVSYYYSHKQQLIECVNSYDRSYGDGFICWRFIMRQSQIQQHQQKKKEMEVEN